MTATQPIAKKTLKSARLGLRTTPEQEAVLRRAAEVCHKSLTEFIMDSAYLAAQNALLDQRLFMISGNRYEALLDLLNQPVKENTGLKDLFSKPSPWDEQCP